MKPRSRIDLSILINRSKSRCFRLTDISTIHHYSKALFVILATLVLPTSASANTKLAGRAPGNPLRNSIGIGGSHSCQSRPDGTVQCWGSNSGGQLGDGTLTSRTLPGPVSGLRGPHKHAPAGQNGHMPSVPQHGCRCVLSARRGAGSAAAIAR